MVTITDSAFLRLMQLSSPSLPVGAYAFSFGLEKAVEARWIMDKVSLKTWLQEQLRFSLARVDMPLILRLHEAFSKDDQDAVAWWNDYLLACRESSELRLSDTAPASALLRILPELGIRPVEVSGDYSFLTLFAQAAVHWAVPAQQMALAYCWSWLENQVIAATKLMPLGQTHAQQMLAELQAEIPLLLAEASTMEDEDIGSCLPALAICSSLHEQQYSRLFRS